MFERFTKPARAAVIGAQTEARDLRQSPIGTQHLLLALLSGPLAATPALMDKGIDTRFVRGEILRRVGPAPAGNETDTEAEDAAALKSIGIDIEAVRSAIEENFGPGALRLPSGAEPPRKGLTGFFGHIPFSRRNKKVLELSLREAIQLRHNYIAPEHLMLGLLREGHGLAAQILADAGVDLVVLHEQVKRSLTDEAA